MARFKVIWTCENFDEYSSERRGANDDVEEHDWIVRVPQRCRYLNARCWKKRLCRVACASFIITLITCDQVVVEVVGVPMAQKLKRTSTTGDRCRTRRAAPTDLSASVMFSDSRFVYFVNLLVARMGENKIEACTRTYAHENHGESA